MTTTLFDLDAELSALQDDYTYRVNMLLDEGREDLAAELSDQYVQDAADMVLRARTELS